MKKYILTSTSILIFTLSLPATIRASDDAILAAYRLMVFQRYPEAVARVHTVLKTDPQNIDAIHALAAIEQTRISDYEAYNVYGRRFLFWADSLLKILEARQPHLTGDDSLRCLFYRANIIGGIGLVMAKRGALLDGARTAMRAAGLYRQIKRLDPNHLGVDLGLGVYDYYLGTSLRWVPFAASGNARRGLDALERALSAPFPFNHAAKNSYCWILIDRRNFGRADSLARVALMEVPNSTIFLRIRAYAALWSGDNAGALRLGSQLAAASEARSPVNWSDLMMGHYLSARAHDNLGHGAHARAIADKALAISVPEAYNSIPHVREHIKNLTAIQAKYNK